MLLFCHLKSSYVHTYACITFANTINSINVVNFSAAGQQSDDDDDDDGGGEGGGGEGGESGEEGDTEEYRKTIMIGSAYQAPVSALLTCLHFAWV